MFVIEHLEDDVFDWCLLEYKHMSKWVGKDQLLFSNTSNEQLKKFGTVEPKPVADLNLKNACLLDPEAEETLTPEKAKQFDHFIFGGILGDDPPRARTQEELGHLNVPKFNIGKEQMSTDTAVIVVKKIVDGTPLEQMEFQEGIEMELDEGESVMLPYKYLIIDGKPLLPPGLKEMLAKQESF